MLAILLAALFAAAAIGCAGVLADSAVRGRNAFRRLRGELARLETAPRVGVYFVSPFAEAPLPSLRTRSVSGSRPALRPARSRLPSLHAAA